jgi:hypothetical protein
MKHSDMHNGSGTVVSINDPSTGMYLDLSFAPGQTHRPLHVMMNGKLHTAYVRLIKLDTDAADDLIVSLRVPNAPSDAPPVVKNAKPHPATVLAPGDETRSAKEALRSEGQVKRQPVPPTTKHPATILRPEDVTRAANEALRVNKTPQAEAERLVQEREEQIQALEPVMSDEELTEMYADVKTRREIRAKLQGSDAPGLGMMSDSDVDLATLNDLPMTDEEVASLHDDAKTLRTREEPPTDAPHELVEGETKKKGKKGR